MNKRDRIKKLLESVKSLESKRGVEAVDEDLSNLTSRLISEESARVASQLNNNSIVKLLSKLSLEMSKIKRGFDIQPIITAIKDIGDDTSLRKETSDAIKSLQTSLKEVKSLNEEQSKDLFVKITSVEIKLVESLDKAIAELRKEIPTPFDNRENIKRLEELDEKIDDVRQDLIRKIANIGGGAPNQQIRINGAVMSLKYADFNLIPGSNITITRSDDNNNKRVNITISASGGGGGSSRSIQSISGSQTADSASGTDYVYLCSGTLTLTMPDATSGNTNLYTVKNVGTGIVTINCTGGQTIDNDPTVIMPVRYTSVDLISDTANWNVT